MYNIYYIYVYNFMVVYVLSILLHMGSHDILKIINQLFRMLGMNVLGFNLEAHGFGLGAMRDHFCGGGD